jgi:hypothetical protein
MIRGVSGACTLANTPVSLRCAFSIERLSTDERIDRFEPESAVEVDAELEVHAGGAALGENPELVILGRDVRALDTAHAGRCGKAVLVGDDRRGAEEPGEREALQAANLWNFVAYGEAV